MAINFDTEYPINDIQNINLERNQTLTICKLQFRPKSNSLLMHIPGTFPEYNKLNPGVNIYFIDNGTSISFSTNLPQGKIYYDRRLQTYGSKTYQYIRVPVPIQLRKKYKLDLKKAIQLVSNDDNIYECIFI